MSRIQSANRPGADRFNCHRAVRNSRAAGSGALLTILGVCLLMATGVLATVLADQARPTVSCSIQLVRR